MELSYEGKVEQSIAYQISAIKQSKGAIITTNTVFIHTHETTVNGQLVHECIISDELLGMYAATIKSDNYHSTLNLNNRAEGASMRVYYALHYLIMIATSHQFIKSLAVVSLVFSRFQDVSEIKNERYFQDGVIKAVSDYKIKTVAR